MKARLAPMLLAVLMLPGIAAADTHTVTIEGMAYRPPTLTVRRGDTVVWRNKDVVPHTATAAPSPTPAGHFDSGHLAPGAAWSWTASSSGRFDYVCTYHPGMKATVVIR